MQSNEQQRPAGSLSPEQVANFERDGFLVVENLVDPESCDVLLRRGMELAAGCDPSTFIAAFASYGKGKKYETDNAAARYIQESADKASFFFEPSAFDGPGQLKVSKEQAILKIGHGLHDCDPVFDTFSRQPRFKALVESLGLRKPLLAESMYMFKHPKVGGKIDIHQDGTFLFTEPSSVIGLWTALEDATVDNGCLWALPGGHKGGLRSRYIRTEQGDKFDVYDATPFPENEFVPLEAKKGSVVVLHGAVPHMSRANVSPRSRQAYSVHLIDGTLPWPAGNWLQRSASNPFRGF
ncbi:phytanoyl-CoA dioxygenase family protein [Pendulispora brunnea]|uniref:Phytanoyl-CoA dioxygenase family protein n=1 Tax=Pendulispora brunnea TaxID=2905690 RepID=A0ABZ2KJW2_9BACT